MLAFQAVLLPVLSIAAYLDGAFWMGTVLAIAAVPALAVAVYRVDEAAHRKRPGGYIR